MTKLKRIKPQMPAAQLPVHAKLPVTGPGEHANAAMVAEAAYYRAQMRGFAPGGEVEDWLAAEKDLKTGASR